MAESLSSKPINLRDPTLFKKGSGESAIAETLGEGVLSAQGTTPQLHHSHHEFSMPKFDHLTELERRSIALYVISFRYTANQKE